MTTPLFAPPEAHILPVSWHGDLVVDFQQYDPADDTGSTPLDYAPGVRGFLDIKTDPVTRIPAVIDGYHAICRVESEIADTLRNGTLWVFVLSEPGDPTTEIPAVNGTIGRYDGKPPQ